MIIKNKYKSKKLLLKGQKGFKFKNTLNRFAMEEAVKKTSDSYPKIFTLPNVIYMDAPVDQSGLLEVNKKGISVLALGTNSDDANTSYEYPFDPLFVAAHEVAHYYDNRLHESNKINPNNYKIPIYNKRNNLPSLMAINVNHDTDKREIYADKKANEMYPDKPNRHKDMTRRKINHLFSSILEKFKLLHRK